MLASVLRTRGHDVVWWTSTFDHNAKRHRAPVDTVFDWNGVEVRMLRSCGYAKNVSIRRFMEHAGIARKFSKVAPQLPRPDILFASLPTLELSDAAVRFGRARNIPSIIDIRDLWPDAILDNVPNLMRWPAQAVLRMLVPDASRLLADCTGIVGISRAYLDWGLAHAAREQGTNDAVFPLGYVAPDSSADAPVAAEQLRAAGVRADRTICWFVGSFGHQYDLAPVIEAARQLQKEGRTDVQFVLSGSGETGAHWQSLAAGLDNVIFTGWIDADQINWLRRHAAIGLQPYARGARMGLANKLFEYLSAGIPVVSSLPGENEKLITQYHCGLTFAAGDAGDCLARLRVLLDDSPHRCTMGENGRRLFNSQFDGAAVFDGLAAHLENCAARTGDAGRG